jgi:hypothetical protein
MPRRTREERIADERRRLRLKPWQFAPSEVDDAGPSPYQPGATGFRSWVEAQRMRAEIRELDPHYFDD